MRSFDIMEALTDMDDELLLLAEAEPRKCRRFHHHAFRHVTAACIAVVMVLTAWFAMDAAATERVLRWTVRYRERGVTWLFKDGTEQKGELPAYEPTWLPEGYAPVWEDIGADRSRSITYHRSGDGNFYINLQYKQITDQGTHHFYDLPEGSYERQAVQIGELPGELYLYTDEQTRGRLVWIDQKNCIFFVIAFNNSTPTDILQIAQSVLLVN